VRPNSTISRIPSFAADRSGGRAVGKGGGEVNRGLKIYFYNTKKLLLEYNVHNRKMENKIELNYKI